MQENILFFCAHNDDQIIGAGGTIAKYVKEGKSVTVIVFSYGEGSNPLIRREITVKTRVRESHQASRILGYEHDIYLGLREGHFIEDFRRKRLEQKIVKMIRSLNPKKIFTHSVDDPHPDHKAANAIVNNTVDRIKWHGEMYCFDVWNPFNVSESRFPRLIVDTSQTFNIKIRAMEAHKSQKLTKYTLSWNLYLKAFYNGLKNGVRYAEVFYKVR